MNLKELKDYLKECKAKGTVPTVKGLNQFHKANKEKYKIS